MTLCRMCRVLFENCGQWRAHRRQSLAQRPASLRPRLFATICRFSPQPLKNRKNEDLPGTNEDAGCGEIMNGIPAVFTSEKNAAAFHPGGNVRSGSYTAGHYRHDNSVSATTRHEAPPSKLDPANRRSLSNPPGYVPIRRLPKCGCLPPRCRQ
jgi:hypothetical protein